MTSTQYRDQIADLILLPGESRELFFDRLTNLLDAFRPRTGLEQILVEEMTINSWYKIRISCLERMIFTWQMEEQARLRPNDGAGDHAAHACQHIAMNSRCLDMLGRWHLRRHKLFRDGVRMFLELRRALPPRDAYRDSAEDILDHISDPARPQPTNAEPNASEGTLPC